MRYLLLLLCLSGCNWLGASADDCVNMCKPHAVDKYSAMDGSCECLPDGMMDTVRACQRFCLPGHFDGLTDKGTCQCGPPAK